MIRQNCAPASPSTTAQWFECTGRRSTRVVKLQGLGGPTFPAAAASVYTAREHKGKITPCREPEGYYGFTDGSDVGLTFSAHTREEIYPSVWVKTFCGKPWMNSVFHVRGKALKRDGREKINVWKKLTSISCFFVT